jgi:hypothetical protein
VREPWYRVDRASFSLSGRNLLTIWQRTTDLWGARLPDPEETSQAGGSSLGMVPPIAGITANLRVSF